MSEPLRANQPVQHIRRKLHEARFVGYTKSGRVKVTHNALYPAGVWWSTDTFLANNIVPIGGTTHD